LMSQEMMYLARALVEVEIGRRDSQFGGLAMKTADCLA